MTSPIVVAAAALGLSLLGMNAAEAAPVGIDRWTEPSASASGEALVRIDGGTGPALVRIDAPDAKVRKVRHNVYRLRLRAGNTGQWLGSDGANKTASGLITASGLQRSWAGLGYRDRIGTTITWVSGGERHFASGHLTRPRVLESGKIRFGFVTRDRLPRQLPEASLNLLRSDWSVTRSFPMSVWVTLSPLLVVVSDIRDASTAIESFKCKGLTIQQESLSARYPFSPLPTITCDVSLTDGSLTMQTTQTNNPVPGKVILQGTITPSTGNPMSYYATIATWTASG